MLLLATTACSSEPSDSTGSLPDVAVEATPGPTDAPRTEAPATATPSDTSPAATDGDEPAPTEPAVAVPEALQFTAPLVGGGTFDGAAAAGKPTVFWFWAPT